MLLQHFPDRFHQLLLAEVPGNETVHTGLYAALHFGLHHVGGHGEGEGYWPCGAQSRMILPPEGMRQVQNPLTCCVEFNFEVPGIGTSRKFGATSIQ